MGWGTRDGWSRGTGGQGSLTCLPVYPDPSVVGPPRIGSGGPLGSVVRYRCPPVRTTGHCRGGRVDRGSPLDSDPAEPLLKGTSWGPSESGVPVPCSGRDVEGLVVHPVPLVRLEWSVSPGLFGTPVTVTFGSRSRSVSGGDTVPDDRVSRARSSVTAGGFGAPVCVTMGKWSRTRPVGPLAGRPWDCRGVVGAVCGRTGAEWNVHGGTTVTGAVSNCRPPSPRPSLRPRVHGAGWAAAGGGYD